MEHKDGWPKEFEIVRVPHWLHCLGDAIQRVRGQRSVEVPYRGGAAMLDRVQYDQPITVELPPAPINEALLQMNQVYFPDEVEA